jgi:hypothetical protein
LTRSWKNHSIDKRASFEHGLWMPIAFCIIAAATSPTRK